MEDIVEQVNGLDALGLGRSRKQEYIYLAIATQLAWWSGGALSYYLTKRRLTAKYEKIIEQEIAEAKEFYARVYKSGDYSTPESTLETVQRSRLAEDAATALQTYTGESVVVEEVSVEIETEPVVTNLFESRASDETIDPEEVAARNENEPYIISVDEYLEGEKDYRQMTLAYYGEDDVLTDEKDQPVNDVDAVVGEGNLTRFGHGSKDNRIVYIRNDKLSMDFEVVKSDGSYTKEVLGFIQHSDRRRHKFRGGDE